MLEPSFFSMGLSFYQFWDPNFGVQECG